MNKVAVEDNLDNGGDTLGRLAYIGPREDISGINATLTVLAAATHAAMNTCISGWSLVTNSVNFLASLSYP